MLNNITVGGFWDSSYTKQIGLEVYECKDNMTNNYNINQAENIKCGSQIKKDAVYNNKLFISSFYPTTIVNPGDYNNELKIFTKNYYYQLDKSLFKTANF